MRAAATISGVTSAPAASVGPSSPSVPPDRSAIPSQSPSLRERGEGELLIATPLPSHGFLDQRDGWFAAGDEAVGPGLAAHSQRHFGELAADFFGRSFGSIGGDHGVRIAEPLRFAAGGVDRDGVVADDEIGDDCQWLGGVRIAVLLWRLTRFADT